MSDTNPQSTDRSERPELIAHRGCAADNPENTVAAVAAAATVADAVEVDVRRCAGGDLVAIHDGTLDRVTDRTGRVARTDCADVLDAEVLESGETVPELREVLESVPDDVRIVLDLKERGLAEDVLELIDGYAHDAVVSSFQPAVLETIRSLDSSVSTAYIVRESLLNRALRPVIPATPGWLYAPEDTAALVRSALDLGCEALHPRFELCLRTDLVSRARDADLRVEPWTVTSRTEFERLASLGVDAIISDVCDGLADSAPVKR